MNASRARLFLLLLLLSACGPGLPGEPESAGTVTPPPAQPQVPVVEGVIPSLLAAFPKSSEAPRMLDVFVRGPHQNLSFTVQGYELQRWGTSRVGVVTLGVPPELLQQEGTLKVQVYGAGMPQSWDVEVRDAPVLHGVSTPYRTLGDGRNVFAQGEGFDADTVLQLDGEPLPTQLKGGLVNGQGTWPYLEAEIPEALWQLGTRTLVAVRGAKRSNPLALRIGEQQPVPLVSSLRPARVSVGGLERTLRVFGQGFAPGATVRVDGVARSATQQLWGMIEVPLTPEDLATPHTAKVTVHAPDGTPSLPLLLRVGDERESPVVESLEPAAVLAGTGSTVLRVGGSGFHGMSQLLWNGLPLSTRVVVPGPQGGPVLEATLSAAMLAAPGVADVAVSTAGPGGGTSEALPFVVRPASAGEQILLSRSAVEKGSGTLELAVYGQGFDAQSRVRVKEQDLVPSWSSSTELRVTLAASTFASPGRVEVRVARPGAPLSEPSLLLVRAQRRAPQLLSLSPGVVSVGGVPAGETQSMAVEGWGLSVDSGSDWATPLPAMLEAGLYSNTLRGSSSAFTSSPRYYETLLPGSVLQTPGELAVRVSRAAEEGGSSLPLLLNVTQARPTPLVDTLRTGHVRSGSAGAVIEVGGAGLHDTSVVRLDGEPLPTRRTHGYAVVATVPAALLTRARVAEVTVTTDAPYETRSRPLALIIE